jgi:sn-glycerol 3-phosphate transport system substrate-binding protein
MVHAKPSLFRLAIFAIVAAALTLSALPARSNAQANVSIDFYFPEASANNSQAIFEEYAKQFQALHPEITVNVIYQGSYTDNRTKIQTEIAAGAGPDVAVMLATDLLSFVEEGAIVPVQGFLDKMPAAEKDAYLADIFPAFLLNNSDEEGTVWTVPFQRSTPVMYYNKALFAEAGLEAAPTNRDQLVEYAQKLTLADGERWGLWLPSEGFPIWLFTAAAIANGQNLSDADPTTVGLNTDAVKNALDFWLKLGNEYKVTPAGAVSWGDTPTVFTSGKAAMAIHTTGSLTRILNEATFEVGVAFVPFGPADAEGLGYGVPTGGGNVYIFKNSTPEEQEAAWLWAQFLSSPEIQANWGARTGYIAARISAWDLDPLKSLVAEKPQYGVARDQLAFAQREFSAYRTIDLQGIINKTLSGIIAGSTPAAEINATLETAQKQIDDLLAEYK